MQGYSLPPDLGREIDELEGLIRKYKRGEVSATELKARRVPFGVYEQREVDTYMVRIRCAAGAISPFQLENVARIASQYGVRDLHITSRQELQIHYVKLDDLIPIIRELKAVGLTTRGGGGNTVRNIVTAPDAGIDPQEEFDVSPYALALTTRLIAENDSWNLPRKFKIAFSGSAEDKGYATLSDVGFIARTKDGKKGFRVYAAGGLGAKSTVGKLLLDFIGVDEVYPVTAALKSVFWHYGNRKNRHAARLRFLWQSLGEEEFKKRFNEKYTEITRKGFSALAIEEAGERTVVSDVAAEDPRDSPGFDVWVKRFVQAQKQKGLFSVLVPVELGFISCARAGRLGRFLRAFGDDSIRMTKDQNFFMRNIPENYLGTVYNYLNDTFADFNRPVIYGRILSCAGASTCQLGICLSRQAAKALMKSLEAAGLDLDRVGNFKLNISGCSNSCGQHLAADLGLSGKALRKDGRLYPAYTVFAGAAIGDGRTRLAEPVGDVAAKNIPALIGDLLGAYLSKAAQYKSLPEYLAGEGREYLKQLCLRYGEVPAFDEDKNYYFDWGTETLFSLAERRSGECSAGIFDLIEMDLKNIKETRDKLSAAEGGREQKGSLLRELVLYSSRGLLITRGVEPKSEPEVYEAFVRNFIEAGLIASSFKDIVDAARRRDLETLFKKENEVLDLARTVESLYENMDNAFNFNKPDSSQKEQGPATHKDLRGVACPLNFVKTKIELSKLKPGDILEILLDDGAPIENVPGSVKAEGHNVIAQKRSGDHWSVLIEKK